MKQNIINILLGAKVPGSFLWFGIINRRWTMSNTRSGNGEKQPFEPQCLHTV
jgi:hypothetical protein